MNKYDKRTIKRWFRNTFSLGILYLIVVAIFSTIFIVATMGDIDCEDRNDDGRCTMHYSNDKRP